MIYDAPGHARGAHTRESQMSWSSSSRIVLIYFHRAAMKNSHKPHGFIYSYKVYTLAEKGLLHHNCTVYVSITYNGTRIVSDACLSMSIPQMARGMSCSIEAAGKAPQDEDPTSS